MPLMGFGTFQLKGQECRTAVACALETGYSSIEDGYGIERTTSFLLIDSPGNLVTFTLHPHEEANDLGQGSSLV